MIKDKDYPPKSGLLPQYANLQGIEENMPVIRQLLGLPEHGRLPDNGLGRILQKFIDNNSKNDVRQGRTYQHAPLEPR